MAPAGKLFVIAAVLPLINGSVTCIAMGKHTKTAKTYRFTDEELALIEWATQAHGTATAGIVAGLRALQSKKKITAEDVILWVKAHG